MSDIKNIRGMKVIDDRAMARNLGLRISDDLQSEKTSLFEKEISGNKIIKFNLTELVPNFDTFFKNANMFPKDRSYRQVETTPMKYRFVTVRAVAVGDRHGAKERLNYSNAIRFLRSSADVPITMQTPV